jgi:uncharacterized protein
MAAQIAVKLINFYQGFIRIFLPASCRFWPTCSEYSKQAILKYGFLKGGFKAVKRISRCHPFFDKSGYDPLL